MIKFIFLWLKRNLNRFKSFIASSNKRAINNLYHSNDEEVIREPNSLDNNDKSYWVSNPYDEPIVQKRIKEKEVLSGSIEDRLRKKGLIL